MNPKDRVSVPNRQSSEVTSGGWISVEAGQCGGAVGTVAVGAAAGGDCDGAVMGGGSTGEVWHGAGGETNADTDVQGVLSSPWTWTWAKAKAGTMAAAPIGDRASQGWDSPMRRSGEECAEDLGCSDR